MEVFSNPHSPQWGCLNEYPYSTKWRFFNVLIHPTWEVFLSLFTPVEVFYVLIHHSGGVSTCLFTPKEVLLHPYSLQCRCLCIPQWRCFHILIHPGQFFCVWRGCHIYTLILTGNCRSTWNIGKALSSMPCLSFKVLFILCFILAKLWLSYLWVSKSIRRDPTGLCCIYLLAVCTPWSKDIHGWYPKLTLL